jgi:hypothetical protein
MELLNSSLTWCVSKIRRTNFLKNDLVVFTLINALKDLDGVVYFEDLRKDHIVFSIPNDTPIRTNIVYQPEKFTLERLLALAGEGLEKSLISAVQTVIKSFTEANSDYNYNFLMKWYRKNMLKNRCRTSLTRTSAESYNLDNLDNFDKSDKIYFSLIKNIYISAHYNAADFPMLSDFEEFKNDLNIVNKSFVTLGKPLRREQRNIYIRDTLLLAPAGSGSLESLSTL